MLFLLFLFVLSLRLYFVFQTENFSSDDAYFHLRHINSLLEEKKFLYYDSLSYGGREVLYPPLFHLIFALLTFGNIFLLKVIPEILLSSLVFVVYFICKEISNRKSVSLICAFMSALVPIFLIGTVNQISAYSLVLPILFLMFYCLTKLDKKFYLILFLILSFLLPLIHPSAFLFIFTMLLYFILSWAEKININNLTKEVMLFSIFLTFLMEFIIYRPAFLNYGLNTIFYNIPSNIFSSIFLNFNFFSLISFIGILVLILGFSGFYYALSKKNNHTGLIFSSFLLGILILLLFKLIPFFIGIMFLSLGLVVLSSFTILNIINYIEQTRLFNYKSWIIMVFLIVVLIFSLVPAYDSLQNSNYVVDAQIHDLTWIKENTPEGSVVLGLMQEGNLIATIAKRKNVLDSDFLLAPDSFKRVEDTNLIYSTSSEAIALKLLEKYNIKYIYFSDTTAKIYEDGLKYVDDINCFKKVRGRIYEVVC